MNDSTVTQAACYYVCDSLWYSIEKFSIDSVEFSVYNSVGDSIDNSVVTSVGNFVDDVTKDYFKIK
jgi:hypothetical protein